MALVGKFAGRVAPLSINGLFRQMIRRNLSGYRSASNRSAPKTTNNGYGKYMWIIGGGVAAFAFANFLKKSTSVHALKIKYEEKMVKLSARERRFIKFSSTEYDGQLYMTPQDFLDSVVEQEPRPRLKRRILNDQDIIEIRDKTPSLKKGSKRLFRDMRDKGLISYTEYLFLLSILTKPQSGFRIAFNMFDTDGNQRVDKNEFLVILKIMIGNSVKQALDDETRRALLKLISTKEQAKYLYEKSKRIQKKEDENEEIESKSKKLGRVLKAKIMERIFSSAWKDKRGQQKQKPSNDTEVYNPRISDEEDYIDDEEGLQRRHQVNTTLLTHFFGKKGNDALYYEGFYKFMDNLQTEVLELEFNEFSKGDLSITEVDFAKILLRYTYLDTEEYDMFLERLLARVKYERGISFNEFRDFCRFLNNLEDFAIAMRMYTLADRAISKSEFSRAVKICTGYTLTKHLIETVFAIFDQDGDGLLSYKEFIAIMKDRLHRGFRSVSKAEGWDAFKYCVKHDLKHGGNM